MSVMKHLPLYSFEEYVGYAAGYYTRFKSAQRMGQCYMNALHEVRPSLAEAIANTYIDPFYDDEKLPAFLAVVAERW